MNNNELKPVSQFEFAIMELADPENAKKHRPFTDEETNQTRADNITKQALHLKIANYEQPKHN